MGRLSGPGAGAWWLVLAFVISPDIKAPGLVPVGHCFKGQQKIEILDSSPGARCVFSSYGPGDCVAGFDVSLFSLFHDGLR